MTPEEFRRCIHCSERIELIRFALGPQWMHWPTPYGNYQTGQKYAHCKIKIATPEEELTGGA